MKQLRKAISCLLCLCLCMGLLPAAFAEEPVNEDVLTWENEEAVEANVTKPTITAQPNEKHDSVGGHAGELHCCGVGHGP